MVSATKKVTLDVAVKTQEAQINSLERKLDDAKKKANELAMQKIQMKLDADISELDATKSEINSVQLALDSLKGKEIPVDITAEGLDAAKSKAEELASQKIEMNISADVAKLEETKSKINNIQIALDSITSKQIPVGVTVDDEQLTALQSELEGLQSKKLEIESNIEKGKVDALEDELNELNGKAINIEAKVEKGKVDALNAELKTLDKNIVNIPISVKTGELDAAMKKISTFKGKEVYVPVSVDGDEQIDQISEKIKNASGKTINTTVAVDGDEQIDVTMQKIEDANGKTIYVLVDVDGDEQIDAVSEKIANANGKTIDVPVTTSGSSSLDGLESKIMGVAGTIGMVDQATQMWEASTARQSQQFYLAANLGANEAQRMQREIQNIVSQVPGDDTFMNQLMTTALAQNTKMTTDELRNMANVAADYMAGSKMMGKMNLESQQDIYKYLLDGNTAELERGSILSSQVDKLKDQATIQDRIKAINEALQTMGYAGISGYDTAANNLEEFQGRLEKARADWGDVFLPLEQGALKFALALDDDLGGAVGMAITGMQGLIPTAFTAVSGFGEFKRGIDAIKETRIGEWAGTVKDKFTGMMDSIRNIEVGSKFTSIKNSLMNIASEAKKAATSFATTLANGIRTAGNAARTAAINIGKTLWSALKTVGSAAKTAAVEMGKFTVKIIKAGAEAVISAGKWLIAKAALVAERTATMLAAGAQAFLNLVMSMNPIVLVVTAIIALIAVLGYLYYTNEDVRNAIDGLGQALWGIGETIYGSLQGALEWLQGAWQNTVDWFNNGAQSISDNVSGAFNWLSSNVTGTFNWLSNTLNGAWQNTVDFFVNGATSISDAVIGAFDYINGAWQNTVDWLTTGAQTISDNVTGAFQWLTDSFNQAVNFFQTYGQLIAEILFTMATGGIGAIALLIGNMNGMPTKIGSILQNVINRILNFITSMVSNFTNGASNAVNNFMNKIRQMPSEFASELQEMIQKAIDFASHLPQILYEAGANAVSNFLNGLGRHSPGIMQRETVAELTEIAERIPGLIDLIGGNLTLIGDKAGEFVSQVQSQIESGMPATEAVITTGMDWIVNGVAQMINMLGGNGDMFISVWNYMRDGALNALNGLIINVSTLPSRIIGYLNNVIGTVSNFAANFANRFYVAASNALNNFMNPVRQIYSSLKGEIDKMLNIARGFADTIANIFRKAGEQMQQMWKWGSGEHSPGFMYDALFGELNAMEAIAKATIIPKLILDASRDMVSNWGNPNLKYSMELTDIKTAGNNSNSDNQSIIELLNKILSILSATGNNGSITFNHYGDTDDEEKLQRILDFIVREINWNNETAGRDTSKYGV